MGFDDARGERRQQRAFVVGHAARIVIDRAVFGEQRVGHDLWPGRRLLKVEIAVTPLTRKVGDCGFRPGTGRQSEQIAAAMANTDTHSFRIMPKFRSTDGLVQSLTNTPRKNSRQAAVVAARFDAFRPLGLIIAPQFLRLIAGIIGLCRSPRNENKGASNEEACAGDDSSVSGPAGAGCL